MPLSLCGNKPRTPPPRLFTCICMISRNNSSLACPVHYLFYQPAAERRMALTIQGGIDEEVSGTARIAVHRRARRLQHVRRHGQGHRARRREGTGRLKEHEGKDVGVSAAALRRQSLL